MKVAYRVAVCTLLLWTTAQGWLQCSHCKQPRRVSRRSPLLFSSSSANHDETPTPAVTSGNTYYKRTFYRFTPGSDADIPNAAVIEERCTLRQDPERPDCVVPVAYALLVRDGQVEEGEYLLPYKY